MSRPAPRKLPGGQHGLTARQVEADQKRRLVAAMIDLVGEDGYRRATVARVIKRAGVSRTTFYAFFEHRAACFAAAQRLAIRSVDQAMKKEDPLPALAHLAAERPALLRLIFMASPLAGPEPTRAYLAAAERWSDALGRKLDSAWPDSALARRKGAPPRVDLDRMALGGLAARLSRAPASEGAAHGIADMVFAVLLPRLGPNAAVIARDQVVSRS